MRAARELLRLSATGRAGGNPDSVGDVGLETAQWGPSVGLWQIRSINAQKGTGGQRDEVANHDPASNARNALAISAGGTNWRPWSTYTTGAYLAYLPAARRAATNPTATSTPSAVLVASNPLSGSVRFFTALLDGHLWVRIGLGLMGLIALVIGLRLVLNDVELSPPN